VLQALVGGALNLVEDVLDVGRRVNEDIKVRLSGPINGGEGVRANGGSQTEKLDDRPLFMCILFTI